jgi:hypothetical protein
MKSFKLAALAIVAFSFASPSIAQTVDPLWTKTLAHSALVKKWCPRTPRHGRQGQYRQQHGQLDRAPAMTKLGCSERRAGHARHICRA